MAKSGQQQRFFAMGEELKVKRRSRLYDKDRKQEGVEPTTGQAPPRPPLDVDVTGATGTVCGEAYHNPQRDEVLVPIRLPSEAVIAVPENRLERAGAPPPPSAQRAEEQAAVGGGPSVGACSPSTIEFWRGYFANEAKARELDARKRKRGKG